MIEVFAAVTLLAVLAAVKVRAGHSGRWIPILFVVGLISAIAIHHHAARTMGMVPDADSSRVVKHALPRLAAALADPNTQLVVVVNGASVTARGLDGRTLEDRLARHTGLGVSVVQLSLAGANHIERQFMARSLVAGLSPTMRATLERVPLVVLWEVHRGYDNDLLAQFVENRGAARAFAYLDPIGALAWLRAASAAERPKQRRRVRQYAGEVLRHVAIATSRIGASRWLTDIDALRPLAGFNPEERIRERARVVGLSRNVERMQAVTPEDAPRYVDRFLVPDYVRSFGNPQARVVYFSPPSRHVGHMAYVHNFCAEHPKRICVGFRNRALLDRLDHRRFWVDGSHLSPAGAEVYTRWLSDVLGRAVIRHDMARQNADYG